MAHVGQKLGLVLARDLELVALILNFFKQPHVLDCNHSLVGKSGGQLDLLVGKRSYGLAAQNDNADWISFAQERQPENCVKTSLPCDSSHRIFWIALKVSNLNGFT